MAALQIPPYRAALLTNADGSPVIRAGANGDGDLIATERQWYMFWQNAAQQINDGSTLLGQLAGLVDYGNHEERPDPEFATDGALYVEWNRGSVIYQNQGGVWQYIAGTMYGTLTPDQRPADLTAAQDAGFQFRTNTDPARAFAWSGTAWIETTPIRYGTHAQRLAAPIADLVSGMLWMETDRDNVVYQVQTVAGSPAWVYVAGTMSDAFAALPPGLGTNDVNFTFATSDTLEVYRWAGAAWVNQTPANTVQLAQGAGTTILTTVFQDVAGLSLALPRPGRYMAVGVVDFSIGTGDAGANMLAQLILPSGAPAAQLIVFGAPILGLRSTVSQQWIFTANAGQTINIQARKNSGTGASSVTSHCSLSAIWLGP